ncbi:hypothetical protein Plhal304r1_c007g0027501 [Plasmopara halstedii]
MLYHIQHLDLGLMHNTYLCYLHTMKDRFDLAGAFGVQCLGNFQASLNPSGSQVKSIAGGTDRTSYNKWKEQYEKKSKKIKEKGENTKKTTKRICSFIVRSIFYDGRIADNP